MKKRKIYKWRWERRLQSGQSKFEGKEDWLEEGLLVSAKKNRIFYGPRRRCTTKLCATIWRDSGAAKIVTVVYQCKHGGVVQSCPLQILRCSM
jgi:hypothetical protein